MRVRDLSANGKLRVVGADRVRFLNGLFTNDVAALAPGRGCHAAMLNVKGKVIAEAIVLADADSLLVEVVPELLRPVLATLERHAIVDDVAFEDHTDRLEELGAYGDDASAAIERALGPLPELPPFAHHVAGAVRVVAANDPLPGYRLIGERGAARAALDRTGVAQHAISDDEWEIARVEAGQPRWGVDLGEEHFPTEARLDDAISYTKGCYMGQEPIARLAARGHLNRRLVGLRLDGDRPAERGARLSSAEREDAGAVTSSVRSPRFGAIALAYLHRTAWTPGTRLTLHEASGPRAAIVSELPFAAPARNA